MYPNAHRPAAAPVSGRFMELFDQLRQEYENQYRTTGEFEHQMTGQLQEMDLIRQKVYQLEQAHLKMKQDYEAEIRALRVELESRGVHLPPSHVVLAASHTTQQPPPPTIGHGSNNIFGNIMASQGGHGAALAPPPPADGQGVALQQAQPSFPYPTPSNGFPPTASPGTKLPGLRGPPATPSQTHGDYKSSPSLTRPSASGGPPVSNPPQPLLTPQSAPAQAQHTAAQLKGFRSGVGNTLADLDIDKLPASQKREGQDWFAVFNPDFTRVLDVDLVHHLVHDSVVCCVRFSADGKYVATGCNRSAQIFDVATGTRLHTLTDISVEKDGDLYIRSVCFSPDGRYLATGAEDRQIRLWDLQTETIKHIFTGHEQDIYSLDFARNGRYIASGSGDKTVRLWDVVERKQKLILSIEDGVTTVAISPDGCYVAAGSLDKSVRVWDTDTGFLVERLVTPDGHRDSVYSVSFAPNGKDLVSGSLDKTIKMWELSPGGPSRSTMVPGVSPRRGKCVRTFEGHKDFVLSVCLTPDGNWVMSGSKDRGVQFWDPITGNAQMMLQGHRNSVISVAPSPDGQLFATGSGDMRARIWRYTSHRR